MSRLGLVTVIVVGGAGVSYAGYSYFSFNKKTPEDTKVVTTIGQKWSKFWISTTLGDVSEAWDKKRDKLSSAVEKTLHPDLQKMRSAFSVKELKAWCDNASLLKYDGVDSDYLDNVRGYCTFDIQDKLTVIKESDDWSKANIRLTNAKEPLSSAMEEIRSKLSTKSPENTNALKSWCMDNYKKSWLGDDDSDFKDVKNYCTTPISS